MNPINCKVLWETEAHKYHDDKKDKEPFLSAFAKSNGRGQLIELVGSPACGKTQMCFSLCAHYAVKNIDGENSYHNGQVIFIDSSGSFSAKRILQMVQAFELTEKEQMQALQTIKCFRAFEISMFLDLLYHILEIDTRIDLLVIDSLNSILSPLLVPKQSRGHAMMLHISRLLHKFSQDHHCPVIYTNNLVVMTDKSMANLRPGLGKSWSYCPSVRIRMDSLNDMQYTATLTKSSDQELGTTCSFTIGEKGVCFS